jgi:hypothetical protein
MRVFVYVDDQGKRHKRHQRVRRISPRRIPLINTKLLMKFAFSLGLIAFSESSM